MKFIRKIVRSNKRLTIIALNFLKLKHRFIYSITNNKILNYGIINNIKYDVFGNNNYIQISKGSIISNSKIYIRGNNHHIIVKENCHIKGVEFWIEDFNGSIIISENTTIESAHLAVTEPNKKISIGKGCMFAHNIDIRTGDSHSIIDNISGKRLNYAKDVIIEDNVWLGAHCKILKGVTISANSIIATGSIVTNNVPANTVVAGTPAKIIKYGVHWIRDRLFETNSEII